MVEWKRQDIKSTFEKLKSTMSTLKSLVNTVFKNTFTDYLKRVECEVEKENKLKVCLELFYFINTELNIYVKINQETVEEFTSMISFASSINDKILDLMRECNEGKWNDVENKELIQLLLCELTKTQEIIYKLFLL